MLICVKYVNKYIKWFHSRLQFLFETLLVRGPKPVSNPKSVNIGLHDTWTRVRYGQSIQIYSPKDIYVVTTATGVQYNKGNFYVLLVNEVLSIHEQVAQGTNSIFTNHFFIVF